MYASTYHLECVLKLYAQIAYNILLIVVFARNVFLLIIFKHGRYEFGQHNFKGFVAGMLEMRILHSPALLLELPCACKLMVIRFLDD